jgi:uncharacterized protein (TIGR03437 family)
MTKVAKITWAMGGLFAVAVPMVLWAHISGPDPRHTAAPGDDPLACTTAGCHTGLPKGGPINAFGGAVTATFSSGSTYTPGGGPITITVTVTDPVNIHYGFQMTARLDSDQVNGQAGDFTPTPPNQIVLCDDGSLKLSKGCPANSQVQFIEHSFEFPPGASATPYVFTWTPPATNVGPVHFYVAGNAVNNNDQPDAGDHVYTNSYVLQPFVPFICTNTAIPVITSVNSLTDEGSFPTFAAGSWLEIKGVHLADPSDPRVPPNGQGIWLEADFNGPNAPTNLDGVSATINGQSAFIYFISPTQIDVLAPADSTIGPVPITVTNCNATSNPTSVTKAALVPGMLAPAKFKVGGKLYMVALFEDFVTFVGNTGLLPGANFRPAKPGDMITAYGIGFGDVTPSFPPGVTAAAANSLVNPLKILFDQTPAKVEYFGIAPGNTSFYQFNIVVPAVSDGDHRINITVGGVTVPQTLFLTVHK